MIYHLIQTSCKSQSLYLNLILVTYDETGFPVREERFRGRKYTWNEKSSILVEKLSEETGKVTKKRHYIVQHGHDIGTRMIVIFNSK